MSGSREGKPPSVFEGDLETSDLRRMLVDAFREAATGILRVVSGRHVTEICLVDGWIADALCTLPEAELGALLQRSGKVSPSQVQLALDTAGPGEGVGERLVRLGYLSREDLLWAQRERIIWITMDVFRWKEGTWRFFLQAPTRDVTNYRISPFDVVVRGFMAQGDPETALEELGGESACWKMPEEMLEALAYVDLSEELDYLALCLDGRTTVDAALALAEVEAVEGLPFLHALLHMGLLEGGPERLNCEETGEVGSEQDHFSAGGTEELEPKRSREESSPPLEKTEEAVSAEVGKPPQDMEGRVEIQDPGDREPSVATSAGVLSVLGEEGALHSDPIEALEDEQDLGLVEEVMTYGTVVEVLFSLILLAAIFVAVLYVGRSYLGGLREDLDETALALSVDSKRLGEGSSENRGEPGGRILQDVSYRILQEEPEPELLTLNRQVELLLEDPDYQVALQEFRAGNYGRAAGLWSEFLGGRTQGSHSLLLGRSCDPRDLRERSRQVGAGFLILATEGGPGCFKVLWGVFPSAEEARQALKDTPRLRSLDTPDPIEVVPVQG